MPIFMIGIQRSGSNLLRLMLNQLPNIAAPHPPHILQRMMPLVPVYGNLDDERSFATLVDDVCRLVELNPVPWEGVELDRQRVAAKCRQRSLVGIFGAVYQVFAEARGAEDWLCKSMQNTSYLKEIEACFPDAKYLYLYRDGRDVAVSFRKAVVGEKHYYHIAKEWADTQRLALTHRAIVPSERFASISYEDLTAHPSETMQRLCAFLNVTYHDSMLDFYRSEEAHRAAESSTLWSNVVKPVMAGNTRKFLREASEDDIRCFESVAGEMLDALGYARAFVPSGQEQKFTEADIRRFDEENRRLKEETRLNTDADDLKRRGLQDSLLGEIRGRKQTAPL
ncbi:MAG TPA: sulfotransferase [Burkholderiales bacterium]|nr:sulfotransferase [Burkholderiales bacterium]